MKKRIVCLTLALMMTATQVVSVSASREDELREEQAATSAQLDATYAQIDQLYSAKQQLQDEINSLDANLVNVMVSIQTLEGDISNKEADIQQTQADLQKAQNAKDKQYAAMKQRIQYLYEKGGNEAWFQMMMSADNLSDLLTKAEYTQKMYDYDRQSLEKYANTITQVTNLGNQYQQEKAELEGMKQEYEAQSVDLQNQIDSGKLKDKYPQLEAVEEYAAKETWIPGLHTLNAPLACEYSSATELRNSDQLGLKYADSLKALLDLETKYTTSKDNLSKLNAVDYSSEIGGGLAIERVAVVQQGNWIGPELSGIDEEVANKMGILPLPLKGVKEDCIPTGISIYWCINSQSDDKEKEASKEFLNWLFQSDEGKQIVVNDFGFVPAFNNYDDVEITDTLSKEVKRYIDEGKTLPWVMGGFPSGYEPKAAADFQGYFSGEYTFDQMVDQLKADFVELKK